MTAGVPDRTRTYFVHSYYCEAPAELVVGETEYGLRFASVVARDLLIATQFHPEKSGEPGLEIYRAFAQGAR